MVQPQRSQERLHVLRMIDEGKITADEGFQLLKVLDSTKEQANDPLLLTERQQSLKGKLVRLQVLDLESGKSKAMATVPLRLLEVGLRIATHYAPGLREMNTDRLLDALHAGTQGRIIEVVDEDQKVRVEVRIE